MAAFLDEIVIHAIRAQVWSGLAASVAVDFGIESELADPGFFGFQSWHGFPPRERALESTMIAEYAELQVGLEQSEPGLAFELADLLSHLPLDDVLCLDILIPLGRCQSLVANPVLASWKREDILGPPQAQRIVQKN